MLHEKMTFLSAINDAEKCLNVCAIIVYSFVFSFQDGELDKCNYTCMLWIILIIVSDKQPPLLGSPCTFFKLVTNGVWPKNGGTSKRWYDILCMVIIFGIIDPIQVILKIEYRLSLSLGGVCSIANYSVVYEETQSN